MQPLSLLVLLTDRPLQNKYFLVPINNTDPIWFYCAQARHCQVGMVGVINPCGLLLHSA